MPHLKLCEIIKSQPSAKSDKVKLISTVTVVAAAVVIILLAQLNPFVNTKEISIHLYVSL